MVPVVRTNIPQFSSIVLNAKKVEKQEETSGVNLNFSASVSLKATEIKSNISRQLIGIFRKFSVSGEGEREKVSNERFKKIYFHTIKG